jgi:hypothetical protein
MSAAACSETYKKRNKNRCKLNLYILRCLGKCDWNEGKRRLVANKKTTVPALQQQWSAECTLMRNGRKNRREGNGKGVMSWGDDCRMVEQRETLLVPIRKQLSLATAPRLPLSASNECSQNSADGRPGSHIQRQSALRSTTTFHYFPLKLSTWLGLPQPGRLLEDLGRNSKKQQNIWTRQ